MVQFRETGTKQSNRESSDSSMIDCPSAATPLISGVPDRRRYLPAGQTHQALKSPTAQVSSSVTTDSRTPRPATRSLDNNNPCPSVRATLTQLPPSPSSHLTSWGRVYWPFGHLALTSQWSLRSKDKIRNPSAGFLTGIRVDGRRRPCCRSRKS